MTKPSAQCGDVLGIVFFIKTRGNSDVRLMPKRRANQHDADTAGPSGIPLGCLN
jgi:hypothetical protein